MYCRHYLIQSIEFIQYFFDRGSFTEVDSNCLNIKTKGGRLNTVQLMS